MDETKQPGLQINQILLTEAHFAHRKDWMALDPKTDIGEVPINIQVKIAGKTGEKTAAVSIRAMTPDGSDSLYSFSVEITAIVSAIPGQENLDPAEYARNMGPAAFFPFLREAVANLTLRGRFGPLWLKPFNFTAAPLQPVVAGEQSPGQP